MASQIFTDISCIVNTRTTSELLRGNALAEMPVIEKGYIIIEGDRISAVGKMEQFPYSQSQGISTPPGTFLLPAWCDSHTHLVYEGSREKEFVDKIMGRSYEEIAAKGGGILQSALKMESASEDTLLAGAWKRLEEVSKMGTGAIEIKSGYGLSVDGELKMLRVIKKLKEKSSLKIKSTFLGAHAFPKQYQQDHEAYIELITEKMLPAIAKEHLADFIDVFCERGFFSPGEMERICMIAKGMGLRPKLHVNQLHSPGGVETGIKLEALSLDHLEMVSEREIEMLGKYQGCATLLPTAAFFLGMPYPPARKLIESGAAITLASDYNPGSSPSGNMNFVISISCIQMKMLPEEAINAATLNGAFAMGIGEDYGSISVGKKANLVFTKPLPSLAYIPYTFGSPVVDKVMLNGTFI